MDLPSSLMSSQQPHSDTPEQMPSPQPVQPLPQILVDVDYRLADWRETQKYVSRRLFRPHRWLNIGSLIVVLVFISIGGLLLVLAPAEDGRSRAERVATFVVVLSPWVVFTSIAWGLLWLFNRNLAKRTFLRHPYQRHHTYVLDGLGVGWREPLSWGVYTWPAVMRWTETKTLLLLYLGENSVLILPKRSLGDQVAWARWLLRAAVDERQILLPPAAVATQIGPGAEKAMQVPSIPTGG